MALGMFHRSSATGLLLPPSPIRPLPKKSRHVTASTPSAVFIPPRPAAVSTENSPVVKYARDHSFGVSRLPPSVTQFKVIHPSACNGSTPKIKSSHSADPSSVVPSTTMAPSMLLSKNKCNAVTENKTTSNLGSSKAVTNIATIETRNATDLKEKLPSSKFTAVKTSPSVPSLKQQTQVRTCASSGNVDYPRPVLVKQVAEKTRATNEEKAENKMPATKLSQVNQESIMIKIIPEASYDLSDFYCTQFGTHTSSNVSLSSEESVDVAMGQANSNNLGPITAPSQTKSSSPKHTGHELSSSKKQHTKPIASGKTKKQRTNTACPLTFLSSVCDTTSIQYSSIRNTTQSQYQPFEPSDDNEKVYPINFINDESTAFMLTYRDDIPTAPVSGTAMLIYAANTQDLKAKKKQKPSKKRKLSESSESSSDKPLSISDLSSLIKKQKVLNKTNTEQIVAKAVITSDQSALQAFLLADQALADAKVWKQLLFSMTISRDWDRQIGNEPGPGAVLDKAFLWSVYPSLEKVLIDNMREFYEMSIGKCMTKEQLKFNNKLLELVKSKAAEKGWVWGEGYNTDKKIRNRLRCYYKSHMQNSKKRLYTILRSPTKPAHIKALAEHFYIIKDKLDNISTDTITTLSSLKLCPDTHTDSITSSDHKSCTDGTASTTTNESDVSGCDTEELEVDESDKSIDTTKEHIHLEMNGQKTGILLP